MKTINNIIATLYQFAMLFGFIANIQMGFLTTRRVAIFISILVIILKHQKAKLIFKNMKSTIKTSFILLSVCFFITLFHVSSIVPMPMVQYFEPRDVVTLVVGVLAMGIWSGLEIKSFEKFAQLIVAFVLVQSICTFISAVNQPFRIYVAEHFMDESYVNRSQQVIYGMGGRAAGIGLAWSMGSLVLAFGCMMLIALKMESKIRTIWFGIIYAIVFGATALMGRTGMIVEVLMLLYYGISSKSYRNVFLLTAIAVVSVFVLNQVLSYYDAFMAEITREWILQFMDSDKVGDINNQVSGGGIPDFSSDFIFGTGQILGKYGRYTFDADSGYVRSYTSIGVVGMFCYYIGMFLMLITPIKKGIPKNMRNFLYVGILVLFVVEYKEPYIGMTIFPFIIFSMALLLGENYKVKKYESVGCR